MSGHARSPWDALLFTRWPDGLAPYAYGSRFWEFLSRNGNDSIVPRFVEKTAGQFIPFRVGRPLRHAGLPQSLTDAWSRSIAGAVPATPVEARALLLVGRLRSQPVPRVSPDGRSLAYLYDDGRGARIACSTALSPKFNSDEEGVDRNDQRAEDRAVTVL